MIVTFTPRVTANQGSGIGMPLFTIEEIVEVTSARVVTGEAVRRRDKVRGITTDSRKAGRGELFVALKGEHYNGHDFVETALRQGAIGAIVQSAYRLPASLKGETVDSRSRMSRTSISPAHPERAEPRSVPKRPVILAVQDPLLAYQQLATHHRLRFEIPVIAVTGSNGKTSTKEMVARVLEERWNVLTTEGNLNNRIGVPQTLLRLTAAHQAAVIEMGVDRKGQTTRLAEITRPTIGIITNIGSDHLEFFRTLDDSAQAKGELLDLMEAEQAVVLNADDPFFEYLAARSRCRVVSFGLSPKAQVRAVDTAADQRGTSFRLVMPGKTKPTPTAIHAFGLHNVSNALAAAAVGQVCGLSGLSIARGLSHFRPAAMRSQVEVSGEITIINDCYNANPSSMKAAIDLLSDLGSRGRTFAVVGDMLELGPEGPGLHRDVGAYLARKGIAWLIACGTLGKEFAEGAVGAGMDANRIRRVADAAEAGELILSLVCESDVVLIKASRGMRMEHVVEALRNRSSTGSAGRRALRAVRKGRTR